MLKVNLLNIVALAMLSGQVYLLYWLTESRFALLLLICALPIVYSNIVLAIKRLHDLNLSGWWVFWIALIGAVIDQIDESRMLNYALTVGQFALLWLARGTDGPNRFGPDPSIAGIRPPGNGSAAAASTSA
jgi:uncharacterized membrane protein YhaH (DUF805 family)